MKPTDDPHFANEQEYLAYLTELERERAAHAARSPAAIRQERCQRRRDTAKNYYRVALRNNVTPPAAWIAGISQPILNRARREIIAENPGYAKLRGWIA
jgi:hypothetical protein